LGSAYRAQSLEIFDRWGVKIYRFNKEEIGKLDAGWDGRFNQKLCNPGVFLYVLELVDENGTTKRLAGDFTLIR
ncbi:MAG: gliding motility-associated C-terminal domain-containing protein, partial [Saprospiraceae bacterium]